SCVPYHSSGYTSRTHALLRAMSASGINFRVMTRTGYPWDRRDRLAEPAGEKTILDGIEYSHIKSPGKARALVSYALKGARKIEEEARKIGAKAIHAASNHTNAMPALIAARRLGLPFQYEMRGLWELSRASRDPAFQNSPAYEMGLDLERFVAENADRLLVISKSLKNFLLENWTLDANKIEILPNCVNRDFIAGASVETEPDTLCYAGSLVEYEGLDTLITAIGILRDRNRKIRLNIAGDGENRKFLENLVDQAGLGDRVFFHGRVSRDMAREFLARCSLVCAPRKPYQVCKLVTPLKLAEAMALGKPIVAPKLPVFEEELGELGYYFESGDPKSLANRLESVLSNVEEMKERGRKLAEKCVATRLWQYHVGKINPAVAP
ncbi:MAG: glycosyltransferase, partial [Desulfovibrio sp.]|nr:glycosyltransferase [Desulfovibrio sp.]